MTRQQPGPVFNQPGLLPLVDNQERAQEAAILQLREDPVPECASVMQSIKRDTLENPVCAIPERLRQCID